MRERMTQIVLLLMIGALSFHLYAEQIVIAPGVVGGGKVVLNDDDADDPFPRGATLDTDPEIENILRRAYDYSQEGNSRDAVVLYQHVLDHAGGTLTTLDEKKGIYRPVRLLVEQELTGNRELLSTYRLSADGEAKGLLESISRDKDSSAQSILLQIVRRFFVSSHGDDAAFQLGCMLMDQFEFIRARRLFGKVLADHPDSSVPKKDILLRLAIANARVGDVTGAKESLAQIQADQNNRLPQPLLAALVSEVVASEKNPGGDVNVATSEWPMPFGTPARDGHMKGLPRKAWNGGGLWTEMWPEAYETNIKVPPVPNVTYSGVPKQQQSRAQLVGRWETHGWIPTSHVLMQNGRIFFKTHAHKFHDHDSGQPAVVCLNASNGDEIWIAREQKQRQAPNTRVYVSNYSYGTQSTKPSSAEEVSLFGDVLRRSMSIVDGTVYHIESQVIAMGSGAMQVRMMVNGRYVQGSFGNTLSAVDARTGKLKWRQVGHRAPTTKPKQQQPHGQVPPNPDSRKFLAAPTPAGNTLLVPISRNGGLYFQGLSPNKGETVWETFLCTEPMNAMRWSPVGIAVEGSEVYVATGYGLVFAIDAADGQIQWAARYRRSSDQQSTTSQARAFGMWGNVRRENVSGWRQDVVIPKGDTVLVMPSDSKHILHFDRRTGQLKGKNPQDASNHVLGLIGDRLYTAGTSEVWCYSVRTGKRLWVAGKDQGIDKVLARGALTDDAIYIPNRNTIVMLDPQTGERLGAVKVDIGKGDPIGNLFCDGEFLVASSMARTYVLCDSKMRLARLEAAIAKGDVTSMVARSKLLIKMGKFDKALADLRNALKLSNKESVRAALLNGLLDYAAADANQAQALLNEADKVATTQSQRVRVWLAQALRRANLGQVNESIDLYLKVAGDYSTTMVELEEDRNTKVLASILASSALSKLHRTKGEEFRKQIEAKGRQILNETVASAGPEAARQITELEKPLPLMKRDIDNQKSFVKKLESKQSKSSSSIEAMVAQMDLFKTGFTREVKLNGPESDRAKEFQQKIEEVAGRLETERGSLAKAQASVTEAREKLGKLLVEHEAIQDRLTTLRRNRKTFLPTLLSLPRAFAGTDVAAEAALAAAEYLQTEKRMELAEVLLEEVSESDDAAIAAAGLAGLAKLHLKLKWHEQAFKTAADLKADYPITLVAGYDGKTGSDVAADLISTVPAEKQVQPNVTRRMPAPPWKRLWEVTDRQTFRVGLGPGVSGAAGTYGAGMPVEGTSKFIQDHVMLLNQSSGKMSCRHLQTGRDLWSLTLKTVGSNTSTSRSGANYTRFRGWEFPAGNMMRDGHVGVLTAPGKVMAISLITGKELWSLDIGSTAKKSTNYNRLMMRTVYGSYNPVARVAAGSGVLAVMRISDTTMMNKVETVDTITGKRRWERIFDSDSVNGLWVSSGYVIVVLNSASEVEVCDRNTGAPLGRFKLKNKSQRSAILWTPGGVMYDTKDGLTLREMPSGKVRWAVKHQANGMSPIYPYRMGVLPGGKEGIGYVAHYFPNGKYRLMVVDIATGAVRFDLGSEHIGRYVYDAAISADGKTFYAVGYGTNNKLVLAVFDALTGEFKTKMDFGVPGQRVQAAAAAAAGDIIPAALRDPPTDLGNGRKRYNNLYTVKFYRKSDGKMLKGLKLPVSRADGKLNGVYSIEVRGNVLLVNSYDGMYAFGHDPKGTMPKFEAVDPPKEQPKPKPAPGAQGRVVPAQQAKPAKQALRKQGLERAIEQLEKSLEKAKDERSKKALEKVLQQFKDRLKKQQDEEAAEKAKAEKEKAKLKAADPATVQPLKPKPAPRQQPKQGAAVPVPPRNVKLVVRAVAQDNATEARIESHEESIEQIRKSLRRNSNKSKKAKIRKKLDRMESELTAMKVKAASEKARAEALNKKDAKEEAGADATEEAPAQGDAPAEKK